MSRRRCFSVHCCLLSPDDWRHRVRGDLACRLGIKPERLPPARIHVNTPWFHAALALNRRSRFGRPVNYPTDMRVTYRWTFVRRHPGRKVPADD